MVLLPLAAHAGEQGHYVPGSWSPSDLISAPAGLTVFAPYISFGDADKARTGSGATVGANEGVDVGADSWMLTPVPVYSPSVKLPGADWAITVVPAYGEAAANAHLTAFGRDIPNATLADSAMLHLSAITGEPGWSGFETSSSGDRVYLEYRSVGDVVSVVERAGYRVDFMEVIASPANAPKSTQDLILIAQRAKKGHAWQWHLLKAKCRAG